MEQSTSEEEAIRAFLTLPNDNVIVEGMREAFVEYIGTSAKLFLLKIQEWRVIFDMSEEDYKRVHGVYRLRGLSHINLTYTLLNEI
eukprot:703549-Amphidinium_carterae.1